jgi:hypothetical protein
MWIEPEAWHRQVALLLKPFYKVQGPEFLIELEEELNRFGLQKYGETVKLARKHLEQEVE